MTAPGRLGETPEQRDDRNLLDLLQELRVATLGVQVLFGFLLVTSYVEPGVQAPLLTAVAAALFISYWFWLPLSRRGKGPSPDSREGDQ